MNYEILIPELEIGGHPFCEIHSNEKFAFNRFDVLCSKYPTFDVIVYALNRKELRKREGILIIPLTCPKGHSGMIDNKNILKQSTIKGVWQCSTCGEIWRPK